MHWSWLTVTMWIFRWRYSSNTIILAEVFAWAIIAFLLLKFLSCLFSEWQILANFCHTHLLIGAVTNNSKFAHASVKSYHIVFLYLWGESIWSNWSISGYDTYYTTSCVFSSFCQVVILIYVWKTDVLFVFIVLSWSNLLLIIYRTMAIFCVILQN